MITCLSNNYELRWSGSLVWRRLPCPGLHVRRMWDVSLGPMPGLPGTYVWSALCKCCLPPLGMDGRLSCGPWRVHPLSAGFARCGPVPWGGRDLVHVCNGPLRMQWPLPPWAFCLPNVPCPWTPRLLQLWGTCYAHNFTYWNWLCLCGQNVILLSTFRWHWSGSSGMLLAIGYGAAPADPLARSMLLQPLWVASLLPFLCCFLNGMHIPHLRFLFSFYPSFWAVPGKNANLKCRFLACPCVAGDVFALVGQQRASSVPCSIRVPVQEVTIVNAFVVLDTNVSALWQNN